MIRILASFFLCAGALAQGFPAKPVRIIVATPSSPQDIVARIVSPKLQEMWKQPVVVENRSGAGSLTSIQTAVKAAPDGYSILVASSSYAITPPLYPDANFDAERDLVPAALLATSPIVIVAAPALNPQSLAELIGRTQQGTKLQFGSPGHGTAPALILEYLMKVLAKAPIDHVPYKGAIAPMQAAATGEVAISSTGIAPAMPFIRSGKVKVLAITSPRRWPGLPDVPTLAEAGYPGFDDEQWIGAWVPAKTPAPLIEQLTADFATAVKDAEVAKRLAGVGYDVGTLSRAEFAAYVSKEVAKWAKVAKDTGAKAE